MKSLQVLACNISVTLITLFLTSCGFFEPLSPPVSYLGDYSTQPGQLGNAVPNPVENGYWDGDGVSGPALIKINISSQKAYFYKGNYLVAQTSISTGVDGRVTPRGNFKVTEKNIDHHSSLYGVIKDNATGAIVNDDATVGKDIPQPGQTFVNAPMPYFLRFNGAVGMHTGHLPGYAASHGCVRLPDHMAKHFFANASLGTPVIVE